MKIFSSLMIAKPSPSHLRHRLQKARVLGLLLSLVGPMLGLGMARAQSGIGDIVYTVGTVTRDSFNRDWAYLLWQATEPGLISNRVFAIYAKPGEPTNTAPFVRKSVVTLQTDARVIEPLLRRAENLGDDQNKLQEDIQQLFGSLIPSNTISRAERLSAVIRGSLNDARKYQNLLVLARNHAGINLSLGFAAAEQIGPGKTTFEIRAFDSKTDKDLAVIGRVTVEAGNPTILPQPGTPSQVPETTAMGDLNLKFRWGTPDGLRRLGLMQFGYNLYRVERGFATAQGWSAVTRPPLGALLNVVATNPAAAKRVNRAPLIPSKVFTIAEAANFTPPNGDTNTSFVMDDDGRGRGGYVNYNFTNGARYFYYVAARDVLGRDGDLSFGLLATVCDKLPPLPPRSVSVVNDYSYNTTTRTSNQALRVIWHQSPNTNDLTTNYWVYRWTNLNQMHALSGGVSNNLIGVVRHQPGQAFNSYLDIGPTSPGASASDYGKTYWYTVRAGDAGACGQNLSGPGGPAFGVLRDRIGPPAGGGFIEINCLRPKVRFLDVKLEKPTNSIDQSTLPFLTECPRLDPRFEWAEFYSYVNYAYPGGNSNVITTNYSGRLFYLGTDVVSEWWTPPRSISGGAYATAVAITCRAGTYGGKVTTFAIAPISQLPFERDYAHVFFEAYQEMTRVVAGDSKERDCREHQPPTGGGGTLGTNDIGVVVVPTPGSKEYRIYRRVDDGPMSLLCQGAVTNVASLIHCLENAPPVNGGNICFFVQLLDEHGNPSPMTLLGCVDSAPNSPLPTPALTKLTPTGDTGNAGMNVSWFCPPYGVERFELRIAGLPTPPDTNGYNLSAQLAFTGGVPASMTFSNFGTNLTLPFYPFLTPKVGAGFGNNSGTFVLPANIQVGKTYIISVRALGQNGNAGEFSNFETFVWNTTNAPIQEVPWPARPLPPTNASFAALAFFLAPTNASPLIRTSTDYGVGIFVGFDFLIGRNISKQRDNGVIISGPYDPNAAIGTNAMGQRFFPIVLYRYQVPNAAFPTVSGDVIQASPLMENIAYQLQASASSTNTVIHDPFITATSFTVTDLNHFLYLWLRDTQPQISGARYRYAVVRFGENREIDQVVLSNEVEVP